VKHEAGITTWNVLKRVSSSETLFNITNSMGSRCLSQIVSSPSDDQEFSGVCGTPSFITVFRRSRQWTLYSLPSRFPRCIHLPKGDTCFAHIIIHLITSNLLIADEKLWSSLLRIFPPCPSCSNILLSIFCSCTLNLSSTLRLRSKFHIYIRQ